MVIGGIIGTVRFHFDMWGAGVAGAVRLEELGVRGRVHMSNDTAKLCKHNFPLEEHITPGHDAQQGLDDCFGISSTFLVVDTSVNMKLYATPANMNLKVDTEYDFSEVLMTSTQEDEDKEQIRGGPSRRALNQRQG